jgi:hypothetical protein
MSPRLHIDDLFSGAYEDELSPIDEARFQSHIQKCAPCAEAYAEFRTSVESLRELPKARMPHVVHLPSTPPIAELPRRPRIGLSWFNLDLLRRFPATALAGGVVAVIIVIALVHGPGSPAALNTEGGGTSVAAKAPGAVAESACSQPATQVTAAPPPVDFGQATSVTAAGLPALHLVLATPSLVVTPGQTVTVYAQLTVPEAGLSAPGATPAPAATISVRPCVSVTVGNNPGSLSAATGGKQDITVPDAEPVPESPSTPQQSLVQFTVPAGLAAGTILHVVATIPAGYGGVGSGPLTATLTLTTH